ncbi:MAG: hypothetical protein ACRC1J_11830, partial [Sandaracinobacteroides sp.]
MNIPTPFFQHVSATCPGCTRQRKGGDRFGASFFLTHGSRRACFCSANTHLGANMQTARILLPLA